MKQLTSLDAQFLNVESSTTTGHVGALLTLDPSTAPGGRLSLESVRDVMEQRLHLYPAFRQRLIEVPLGLGLPYWVDDPEFDLEYHLRDIALPAPGDEQQLGEQVARIHARPLDRSRPLWEMYLMHGVHGDGAALYYKIHHAAIDGVSGAEILATLLDPTVEPREVGLPGEDWAPEPLPGLPEVIARTSVANARLTARSLVRLPRSLSYLADLPGAANIPGARQVSAVADAALALTSRRIRPRQSAARALEVPHTPFNGPLTAHRRVAYGSVPLEQVKKIKDAFELTVNDVVMTVTTTALRRWLLDHDALPSIPLVAAVPVSVRARGAEGIAGNQISVMIASLPTHIADPGERLEAVHASMLEAKDSFEALPATLLQDLSAVLPTALSSLSSKALFRLATVPGLPFNLFVSNVPGPQLTLYVAGARVLGIHPVSAVTRVTGGLNVTLFSYDGALNFGLIASREMVPDLWNMIGYLTDAVDELLALADSADG
jgi:WS/DGAT/MGAT family acyltransferase